MLCYFIYSYVGSQQTNCAGLMVQRPCVRFDVPRCAGAVGASPLSQAATVLGVNTLRRPCQTKAAQSKTPSVILSCYDLFSTAATVRLLRNGSNYWTACELSLW